MSVVLATDNFNRANGVLTSPWTRYFQSATFSISSNQVIFDTDTDESYLYTGVTYSLSQYAQAALSMGGGLAGSGTGPGVILRANGTAGGGGAHYRINVNNASGNNIEVGRWNANSFTSLGFLNSSGWANGDILKVSIDSSHTIRVYRNGTVVGSPIVDVTPILTAGVTGIGYSGSSVSMIIDNWEAGELFATSNRLPVVNFDVLRVGTGMSRGSDRMG